MSKFWKKFIQTLSFSCTAIAFYLIIQTGVVPQNLKSTSLKLNKVPLKELKVDITETKQKSKQELAF